MGFTYHKDSFGQGDTKMSLLLLPDDQFAGTLTPPSVPGDVSVTGIGFQPDCVIFLGTHPSIISQFGGRFSMGMASSDASDQQWALGIAGGYLDGAGSVKRVKAWRPGYCFTVVERTGTEALRASLSSMDVDGFTLSFDIVGGWLSPTHAVDEIAFLALKGDFLVGVGQVGDDISGAPFQPQGVWVASSRSTKSELVTDAGWQVAQGAATGPDPQFSMTGGAINNADKTTPGIRSTSYRDIENSLTLIKPADAAALADVAVIAQGKWNLFTADGVSWFWTSNDLIRWQYGYLLTGCPSEVKTFDYPAVTSDPGVTYRDVSSSFEPTAMLMTNLGNPGSALDLGDFITGGHAYFSFGAKNPTGWLDRGSSDPPEEFSEAFAESSGGFGTGGGFSLTQCAYRRYWQAASWAHASEPGGFTENGVNVVETFLNPTIIDMMWRWARRVQSRVRTPATRTTAGGT